MNHKVSDHDQKVTNYNTTSTNDHYHFKMYVARTIQIVSTKSLKYLRFPGSDSSLDQRRVWERNFTLP